MKSLRFLCFFEWFFLKLKIVAMKPLAAKHSNELQILAANIRFLRKKSGLTQMKLAEIIGVEPQYIQMLEYGKTNPSIAVVLALKKAFKAELNDFFTPITLEKQQVGRPKNKADKN